MCLDTGEMELKGKVIETMLVVRDKKLPNDKRRLWAAAPACLLRIDSRLLQAQPRLVINYCTIKGHCFGYIHHSGSYEEAV